MIETIYSKWQKHVLKSPYSDSIPLYQKKNVFLKFLEAIYHNNNNIYYLLPEIIDFVESNGLNPHNFLDTLFILRDEIVAQSAKITDKDFDVYRTLELLQDITIKIGAYFTHLRMDLNITRNKVQALDSDRIEANILQLNEDFIIEKTNSSLLTYFGYEKQEVIGKTLTTLFSSSSQTILNNALSQLKNNQRFKIDLEIEAENKNGRRFQALLKISRLNIHDSPAKYTAYIQDNTYIHETKSMLNLLSMALESVGEGIVIFEPKENGNILYANEAMEKISGFPRHQLLGKSISVLRDSTQQPQLEKEILEASLNNGWKGEITNKHKKGHSYIIHLHTQPVKDEYGKIVALVGIERDITRQKSRETQIIHLKKFVEHIINNLPHFVFVTDHNLNIKFWNQSLETELSIDPQDAIDKNVLEILPELKKFHLDIASQNVLKTGNIFSKKFLSGFADNEEHYYQLYITPINTDEEKQLLWTILDITKEELLKIRITWQNARLKFLENFSQLLNSSLDIKSIFKRFAEELKEILPFKTLSFLLPNDLEKYHFSLFYLFNEGKDIFPQNHILDLSSNGIFTKLIETVKPQIQNIEDDPKIEGSSLEEVYFMEDVGQVIHFPINFEKEILGILNIGHEEINHYKQNDLDFLQQIASHLAIALKNSFYFNLIELQNKKLFIINSIFNIAQNSKNIPQIYQNALQGLSDLLQSEKSTFYKSEDGRHWEKIRDISKNDPLPDVLDMPTKIIKERTIFWNKFQPAILDLSDLGPDMNYYSGLFSWESSSDSGHLGFLAMNNHILDQINQEFMAGLIQDVIKQMLIAMDQINLFEKVKRAENEWETTFKTVNIALAVVDEKFKVIRANKAFSDLFNQEAAGINGQEFGNICLFNFAPIKKIKKAASRKRVSTFEDEYFDEIIQKSVKRSFFPIYNPRNQFKGGVFSIYDITRQRAQEAKIEFLSKFPETNPNLVISIDQKGQLHYLNPAAQKLLKSINLSEKEIMSFLPGDTKSLIQNFNGKHISHIELEHKFQDRVFHYIVYQPSDDNHFYFYGTDITERVGLQRQLLQTERIRAVGEMAAGVAHDFNNLLATILGRTQLLLLKSDNNETKEQLKIVEKAAIDGGQIVKRMQEVTREKRDSNYQALDVNELIKESIIFTASKLKVSTQLKDKKVQLHTDFRDFVVVKGDAVELKEVFTNLILNAYDAMPNGGNLEIVSQKVDDKRVRISFKDTGLGMPEEIRNKIFNPFFTTKGEKGTGLGLSIVYKTITGHGGNIKVESEINKGSTFTIILPLTEEPIKPKDPKELEIEEKSTEIRLLIVDDEPELLDTMAEILRLKFKSVEIASSGQIALEKVGSNFFDVVLTDLGMPEMSGWELARRVKESLPESHIILVTGWGDQAREELQHHPYVDEILPKPYELKELIGKINKVFKNHKPDDAPEQDS